MDSAMLAQAFIRRRVLDRASAAPFHLTQGDIALNSQQLAKQLEPPQETTTNKIWTLLRSGTTSSRVPVPHPALLT
eukprot:11436708-Karenia_brevis.AAC.1